MKLEISHDTTYQYDRLVQVHPHVLYLRPRENPLLRVSNFRFTFEPDASVHWMRDDFDNLPASVQFTQATKTLSIRSSCIATTTDTPPFDFLVRDYAMEFPFEYEPLHRFNLGIYLAPPNQETDIALKTWLDRNHISRPTNTVQWLFELNKTISNNISYKRREEPGIQTALTTISLGSGTCRDFAVLFIDCARASGLAARFVSGYLYDPANNGTSVGDMHAWVEVFIPGAGWRGLDPTHGIFCDNAYVPVAHAVVAESVNPVQGSFFSATPAVAQLTSDVRVRLAAV